MNILILFHFSLTNNQAVQAVRTLQDGITVLPFLPTVVPISVPQCSGIAHLPSLFLQKLSLYLFQYNLDFDKLFRFKLFPDWIYKMQDKWYLKQAAGGLYGPSLDSPSEGGLNDVGGGCVEFEHDEGDVCVGLNGVCVVWNTENRVLGDLISLDEGWSVGFLTRPVVGGHFSLLGVDTMSRRGALTGHRRLFGSLDVDALMANLVGIHTERAEKSC